MVACVEWMKWSGVSDSMFPCGCAFSALTLLVGRQKGHPACKKLEWWGAGVVICLERGADLHVAQLMPLPLTVSCFSKIQIGLPFWYRLTRVVLDKGPLNGCVCVCVCYLLSMCAVVAILSTSAKSCRRPCCGRYEVAAVIVALLAVVLRSAASQARRCGLL